MPTFTHTIGDWQQELDAASLADLAHVDHAAAASMGQVYNINHHDAQSQEKMLAFLMGSVAPPAAVHMGEFPSPYMNTPVLDGHPDIPLTPFTPDSAFTATLSPIDPSSTDSPRIEDDKESTDFRVANYLGWERCLTSPPVTSPPVTSTPVTSTPSIKPPMSTCNYNTNATANERMMETETDTPSANWIDEPRAEASDCLFPPLSPGRDSSSSEPEFRPIHPSYDVKPNPDFGDFPVCDFMEDLEGFGHAITTSVTGTVHVTKANAGEDANPNTTADTGNTQQVATTTAAPATDTTSLTCETTSNGNEAAKRKHDTTDTVKQEDGHHSKETSPAKDKKPYPCPICGTRFNRSFNLKTHIKTHNKTRVREFGCHVCSKSFDRKHDRERHLSTVHRGERSHSCHLCTSSFSRKDALTRHLVQKHGQKETD